MIVFLVPSYLLRVPYNPMIALRLQEIAHASSRLTQLELTSGWAGILFAG